MAGKQTSSYKAHRVVRPSGQTTCVHHKQVTLDWFCETCRDPICAKCISTTHKGHIFVQLSEVTPQNKQKIKTFINETKRKKFIQIQQEINSTTENLKNHLSHFEIVTLEVMKQGEKLKEELEFLIAQTLSRVKHLEEEGSKLLIRYQKELEEKFENMKNHLNECRESLQIGTDIQVFDIARGLNTYVTLPGGPSPGNANFSPNKNPERTLEQSLGTVTLVSPDQSRVDADYQTSSDNDQSYVHLTLPISTSNDVMTQISPPPQTSPLPQTKVLSKWTAPYAIGSTSCPSGGSGIWTRDCYSRTVTCFTIKGDVENQVKSPIKVIGICTSPVTNNLWTCSKTYNSVMELISGTFIRRFSTKDSPMSICVTNDNRILVGTAGKITEYSIGGTPGHTTTITQAGKPLVCTPQSIALCPVSGNVAVVDLDKLTAYSKSKPHLTVMDKHLHELYHYGRKRHRSRTGLQSFDPWDLAYDSQGCLVVSEFHNRCLHLLNGDGQYLRLLHVDKGFARSVCVDSGDVLWAVFGELGTEVKLLQYTNYE
ncbi:uncharacterized protein LOC110459405 [Mizuhopecten yessoensis]|uniref:uncharacterized protein LOC110459405 n=1 Tax=Mizuhopecten yessoensis TaxID=6573 RepID=UPI000B45B71B|nr:uncharacterized protein LOC110459405 [Mizuhopecten yessoensis]